MISQPAQPPHNVQDPTGQARRELDVTHVASPKNVRDVEFTASTDPAGVGGFRGTGDGLAGGGSTVTPGSDEEGR